MLSNRQIRSQARSALGGLFARPWLMGVAVAFIIGLILALANSISAGFATLFLTGPLYVGLHRAFLKIAREDTVEIEDAFAGCYDFGSNLALGIMHQIIIFLWSLLFIIPGIVKKYSFAMAYFVKSDNPSFSWRECLDESERLMKGHRFKYFLLQLGFIGWDIVAFFVPLGLGYVWLNAYKSAASAVFYDELQR